MSDRIFDAKGLKCPMPIAKISGELKSLESGQTLEVSADDPAFGVDVEAFCRVSGNLLEDLKENEGIITAIIKKK